MTRQHLMIGLIATAAATRLLPHAPNFTPLLALAIFAGQQLANFRLTLAVLIPSMLLIDLPLALNHFTNDPSSTALLQIALINGVVYASIAGLAWLSKIAGPQRSLLVSIVTTLGASIAFFSLTNFAAWLAFYPKSFTGLIACYSNALPYFKNTWLSTLLYSGVLFGGLALFDVISLRVRSRAQVTMKG